MSWKIFIGSTFYSSYLLKRAPGTSTSFIVFLILYLLNPIAIWWRVGTLITLTVLHFFCYPSFASKYNSDDPSFYTLDEAIALVLLSLFFTASYSWIFAFLLFRLFDIFKPLGIRKIEKMAGLPAPIRNLGDDLLAAVYTFIAIFTYETLS